jgi:hypothetical protein
VVQDKARPVVTYATSRGFGLRRKFAPMLRRANQGFISHQAVPRNRCRDPIIKSPRRQHATTRLPMPPGTRELTARAAYRELRARAQGVYLFLNVLASREAVEKRAAAAAQPEATASAAGRDQQSRPLVWLAVSRLRRRLTARIYTAS